MSNMKTSEFLFGAFLGSQGQLAIAGGNGGDQGRGQLSGSGEERDPTTALAKLLDHYSDPGKFGRMPILIQAAVCDSAAGLLKLATGDDDERRRGRQFVNRYGLEHHRWLLNLESPPPTFQHWYDFSCFTRNQRIWQQRIFSTSKALRQSSCGASGTDELARSISRQIERDVNGAAFVGQVYTAPRGGQGRPPAIEAAISYTYGVASRKGLIAMDGKDAVTEKGVRKVASECLAADRLHPEVSRFNVKRNFRFVALAGKKGLLLV